MISQSFLTILSLSIHEHKVSFIHVLILSAMFCSFHCTSLISSWLSLFPSILSYAIINVITVFLSFWIAHCYCIEMQLIFVVYNVSCGLFIYGLIILREFPFTCNLLSVFLIKQHSIFKCFLCIY